MKATHEVSDSGIESYDHARWKGGRPALKNVVVRPQLSCLFQQVPSGLITNGETVVPPNDTHHILLFWTEGSPKLDFQLDADRRRARVEKWQGMHIPPGLPSWWENSREASHGLFHVHLAQTVVAASAEDRRKVDRTAGSPQPNESLKRLAQVILAETAVNPTPSQLLWDSYSVTLAHHLYNAAPMAHEPVRGGLAPWQLRRCVDYLTDRARETVGLQQLASLVGLSSFHFARAFKQSTGIPPHRYQTRLRYEKACHLLETTNVPATEIALTVGYESSQALARVFARELGVTPTAWRRERRR